MNNALTTPYRLLGLLPLFFFTARLIALVQEGQAIDILWVCHISNLLMAAGLLANWPEGVRAAVLWLFVGAFLWPIEVLRTGVMALTSFGTHYFGLTAGLIALPQLGLSPRSWLYSWLWFIGLRLFCGLFTPAASNINLAHAIYPGSEPYFPNFAVYWIVTTAGAALSLWLISKPFAWFFASPAATNP